MGKQHKSVLSLFRYIDCVNSIFEKPSPTVEDGPKTPNKRAPLASGGRTRGRITRIFNRNLPRNLYLAKQYASGIPKTIRRSVEIKEDIEAQNKSMTNLWSL